MDYYSDEVRRRWQRAAQVIAEATGRPVRRLTAEHRRDTPQEMPWMRIVSVEFAGGGTITRNAADELFASDREVREAIEALAPTIRVRAGALYARAAWTVEQEPPPGRRTAFGDLIR
jgi:hypothetical protein